MKIKQIAIGLLLFSFASISPAVECEERYFAPEDYENARPLTRPHADFMELLRLASKGDAVASRSIGVAYETGFLVSRCREKASLWYSKAAKIGDETAKQWVARHGTSVMQLNGQECAGEFCGGQHPKLNAAVNSKPNSFTTTVNTKEWYLGTYQGKIGNGSDVLEMTVMCESSRSCRYSVRMGGRPSTPSDTVAANNIEKTGTQIPNNNLRRTAEILRQRPEEYSRSKDAPLLQALRPIFDSGASFSECVGQPEIKGAWGHICQVQRPSSDSTLPDAVMLVTTMNPSCGTRVFCAYMMFPLFRVR